MLAPALWLRPHRSVSALVGLVLLVTTGCAPMASVMSGTAQPPAQVNVPSAASLAVSPPAARQAANVPAGRILYVRDGNLWLWQGGNSRQFSEGGTWYQPAFSPAGDEIAYVYWADNFSDLFLMAADGSTTERLTHGQSASLPDNSWAFRPSWSPDGERLAYVSDANSVHNQVWLINRDGSGRHQLTSELNGFLWADSLTWEPNGERLAVTGAPDIRESSHIYLLEVETGASERLTSHANGAFDPAWSPDGEALAYIGRNGPRGELWVRSLDGSREAHLDQLPYVRSPVWSPDGKHLAVLAPLAGVFEIWLVSVTETADGYTLGEPVQLTRDGAVDPVSGLTWAP